MFSPQIKKKKMYERQSDDYIIVTALDLSAVPGPLVQRPTGRKDDRTAFFPEASLWEHTLPGTSAAWSRRLWCVCRSPGDCGILLRRTQSTLTTGS